MNIKPFKVEQWMNAYENDAKYNIAETCVDSVSLDELFALAGLDKQKFWDDFCRRRLTYGDIEGNPVFCQGICALYKTIRPEEVVPTHGAAGANHHVFYSLVEPGDRVISVFPSYQQLTSIPEAYGADLHLLRLRPETGYLPDLEEMARLAVPGTKLICINNPNNPSGSLMDKDFLLQIVEIARKAGAYLLCDEVYRHLAQEEGWCESIADLYEKGVSVSSMSKVFSLAGLRLGWIASHDKAFLESVSCHRDYNHISCGMLDEQLAAIALEHRDALMARSHRIVRENLQVLDDWVASEPRIHYVKPRAGTTALVYYDYPLDSYDFCRRLLKETGALVTPGDCFETPGSMRIGFAGDGEELRQGLRALSGFLRKLEQEES